MSLPFDVSWEPDLWGKVRNTMREYQYASQVSAADLENERLTEQADLAEYYFELRGQDALQDLYNKTVEADKKALELTKALYETGIDSDESVAQAEVTLQNAQEAGTGHCDQSGYLRARDCDAYRQACVELLAAREEPGYGSAEDSNRCAVAAVAAQAGHRRSRAHDGRSQCPYRRGEGRILSVPIADRQRRLGIVGNRVALFGAGAVLVRSGASASETIFDAGLRKATVAQYTAQYNADVATYRQTVLTAFQQVEDYIATLRVTSGQISQQDAAVKSAQRYVDIATSRYQTGLDPYLDVISAQTTLLSDQQTAVTLRVSEMTAAVELVQALGGGWDTTQLPAAASINTKGAQKPGSGDAINSKAAVV